MTLIITALADDAVVQVSDRRLTANGNPLAKPENKAVCVSGNDANFTIAFTGVARIGSTPTAEWVVNELAAFVSELTFPELVERLRQTVTITFNQTLSSGGHNGLTFVLAGFGPPGPFAAIISNMEDGKGGWFPAPKHEFTSAFLLRNNKRMRKLALIFNGREDAIPETIGKVIARVQRHFLQHSPFDRARILVDLVRRSADHPKVGKYIGKDCTSVIVPVGGDFVSHYHPIKAEPLEYGPNLITNGMVFKHVTYSLPLGWTLRLGGK